MALKENYKDDILDTSQNVKRKYQMENNGDGTVSFTDVTEYTQQGDSFGSGDINATNTKVNALESDIGEINDNLNGFTYYPAGEVDLVASVSDDSYYTDANGKYVLADSPTGESLIDDITYKSLASNEDLRGKVGADTVTPFKTVEGFNTEYQLSDEYKLYINSDGFDYLPVEGYSKIGIIRGSNNITVSYKFKYSNGTYSTPTTLTLSVNVPVELNIPNNAIAFAIQLLNISGAGRISYGMKA